MPAFCWDSRLIISKNAWLPLFIFVDSNSPFKDLLYPRCPNVAQKTLYLVGTVLNEQGDLSSFLWSIYEIIHICTAVVDESEK